MNNDEMLRVQAYMRKMFGHDGVSVRRANDDLVEVHIGDEFLGTLFRDDEDGDVSYAFNMAILEMDLPEQAEQD